MGLWGPFSSTLETRQTSHCECCKCCVTALTAGGSGLCRELRGVGRASQEARVWQSGSEHVGSCQHAPSLMLCALFSGLLVFLSNTQLSLYQTQVPEPHWADVGECSRLRRTAGVCRTQVGGLTFRPRPELPTANFLPPSSAEHRRPFGTLDVACLCPPLYFV